MSQPLEFETSPAERRRQKVRGAILEAAERVFSTEGEAGLSIRRLAEEIDYSPSAIYKYFGSKEELVDELKEAFFRRLMQSVDRAALQTLTFDQRVRRCLTTYVEVATERPHHYLAAFSSLGSATQKDALHEDWASFRETKKGQAFGTVVALVEEGQDIGIFDCTMNPHLAAKSLWASMHGLAQLLIHLPGLSAMMPEGTRTASIEEFTSFHVGLMVRSLQPGASTPGQNEKRNV